MLTEFTGSLLMKIPVLRTYWQGGHRERAKSHLSNGLTTGRKHNKPLQWTRNSLAPSAWRLVATELSRSWDASHERAPRIRGAR